MASRPKRPDGRLGSWVARAAHLRQSSVTYPTVRLTPVTDLGRPTAAVEYLMVTNVGDRFPTSVPAYCCRDASLWKAVVLSAVCYRRETGESLEQLWLSVSAGPRPLVGHYAGREGGKSQIMGDPPGLMHFPASTMYYPRQSRPPGGRISIEENPGMEITIGASISHPHIMPTDLDSRKVQLAQLVHSKYCVCLPHRCNLNSTPRPVLPVQYFHGDSSSCSPDLAAPGQSHRPRDPGRTLCSPFFAPFPHAPVAGILTCLNTT